MKLMNNEWSTHWCNNSNTHSQRTALDVLFVSGPDRIRKDIPSKPSKLWISRIWAILPTYWIRTFDASNPIQYGHGIGNHKRYVILQYFTQKSEPHYCGCYRSHHPNCSKMNTAEICNVRNGLRYNEWTRQWQTDIISERASKDTQGTNHSGPDRVVMLVCHLLQFRKKWKFLGFGLWRQGYFRMPTAHRNHSFWDQIWYFLDYLFITGKIRRDSSIWSLDIITRLHCMTLSIMAWNLKRYIWWWDFDTDFHYYFFDTPMVTSLLDHWYIVFYDFCVFLEFGSILVFSLKNFLLRFAALT